MTPTLTRPQPPAPAPEANPDVAHSAAAGHAHTHHAHAPAGRATHSPMTALVAGASARLGAAALASVLLWLVVAWALS